MLNVFSTDELIQEAQRRTSAEAKGECWSCGRPIATDPCLNTEAHTDNRDLPVSVRIPAQLKALIDLTASNQHKSRTDIIIEALRFALNAN